MASATGLHHVHMTRPDPRAPSSTMTWRAWTEMTAPATGVVITQEGHIGGRITQVEVGPATMQGLTPSEWLDQEVAARLQSNWTIRLASDELRIAGSAPERLYSVVAEKDDEYRLVTQLARLLDRITDQPDIDWVTPETLRILEKDQKPPEWEAEAQIGRDRIVMGVGRRRRRVVVASVPEGSLADKVLAVWTSSLLLGPTVSVTDEQGREVERKDLVASLDLPEWLEDLAASIGVRARLPKAGAWGSGRAALQPIVF